MVETVKAESKERLSENFNVPVIFVEDRDDEVNGQIITVMDGDHYSPSVRSVYVAKPSDSTSGFGFHLSRSKWDPYPYISRIDDNSYASSSGLKEGDCLLEVDRTVPSVDTKKRKRQRRRPTRQFSRFKQLVCKHWDTSGEKETLFTVPSSLN